jgi:hypothetical protein
MYVSQKRSQKDDDDVDEAMLVVLSIQSNACGKKALHLRETIHEGQELIRVHET